jgi:hypothetical protein
LVGEDANHCIVASIMVGHDGHRGWLYYVAVDPGSRRVGFGRLMVEAGEAWLRALDVVKVLLLIRETNGEVASFYEHLGFEVTLRTVMAKWLVELSERLDKQWAACAALQRGAEIGPGLTVVRITSEAGGRASAVRSTRNGAGCEAFRTAQNVTYGHGVGVRSCRGSGWSLKTSKNHVDLGQNALFECSENFIQRAIPAMSRQDDPIDPWM